MKNMEKDFWILREGDLLPESTKFRLYTREFLDELKEAGLLFESKDEAMQVANILRNTVKLLMIFLSINNKRQK